MLIRSDPRRRLATKVLLIDFDSAECRSGEELQRKEPTDRTVISIYADLLARLYILIRAAHSPIQRSTLVLVQYKEL